MRRLSGRVAAITGAASGIGKALSGELAGKGCDLALVDVDEAGLALTAESLRDSGRKVSLHVADVADVDRMQRLPGEVVGEHGHVHIVVNNAGVAIDGTIAEIPVDHLQWIVGINFWGVLYGCKFFLPHLRREDEAHIVNISSVFGLIGLPRNGPYCATKFAVRGLSEALWAELADDNIGVTCVHPGGVRTNIVRSAALLDETMRAERVAEFERVARMSPERAAQRIVRAIERNRMRLRLGPETYVVDWVKRLFPVFPHRAFILRAFRRFNARRQEQGNREM